MGKLMPTYPAADLLPVSHGPLTLSSVVPDAITSLAPLSGSGLVLPQPNRSLPHDSGVLLWSAAGQALLVGPAPTPVAAVAMTDQTDAWVILRLEGAGAEEVLARLTPIDLNPAMFKVGHVARSLLGHMNVLFHRTGPAAFEIFVFRSMTASAVHEILVAMKGVTARADL
ncbi:MAG: sarcosine oxidase subunit gamma family protein [Jannaschia sp.]